MEQKNVYLPVYTSLVILTLVSFGSFYLGMGRIVAVSVALGLASMKAVLIGLYFMHLKSEHPLIYGVILAGLAAVVILAIGILPDLAV